MDKLIELLNEYQQDFRYQDESDVDYRESRIISKSYGFIERLVENDKIDLGKLFSSNTEIPLREVDGGNDITMFSIYESLLMILSIQDDTIEYLCSILKE